MSQKEARRPGLVQAALDGKISNDEGARALGMSVRQFQRLKVRYRVDGLNGLAHGNRGRCSPRRACPELRDRVLGLLQGTYRGFNDHHFVEKLREVEDIHLSRELIRRWRHEAGIAPVRRRRPVKHRHRRLREARRGALVLLDGSEFAWLGGMERLALLGAIDDATGEILALHFRPHEDLHGYTELLRRIARAHGIPLALYGDRLGVFVRNDRYWSLDEELRGARNPTHFGQILTDLAIGFIPAGSPQAKGRIERLWSTLQDRLTNEMRLRQLSSVDEAEAFLPDFLSAFNRRFAHSPRETPTAWRRPPRAFDQILSCRYERIVSRDNTVAISGRWAQIPPGPHGRSYHLRRVEVRELLDGRLLVFHQGRLIAQQPSPVTQFVLTPRDDSHTKHRRAALGLQQRPPQKSPAPMVAKPAPAPLGRKLPRPGPHHPWRTKSEMLRQKLRTGG